MPNKPTQHSLTKGVYFNKNTLKKLTKQGVLFAMPDSEYLPPQFRNKLISGEDIEMIVSYILSLSEEYEAVLRIATNIVSGSEKMDIMLSTGACISPSSLNGQKGYETLIEEIAVQLKIEEDRLTKIVLAAPQYYPPK